MQKQTSAEKYEILFDLPEGDYGENEIGGIRTRTVRAGESLEVEAFPITHIASAARHERDRRKSSPAQQLLNDENARKKIRRLLEKNFTAGDIVIHPTFDYGFVDRAFASKAEIRSEMQRQGFPMDYADAKRIIVNFMKRLKRVWKKKGGEAEGFKYLYVVESTREPRDGEIDPLPAHYHYHMVVSSGGILTIDDINAAWGYGYTHAQLLDFRFDGLAGLASYITKQLRKNRRRWAHSQNLQPPDITVSNRKISRRRASLVAQDVQANGREIFEKLYPGYRLEEVKVRYSDFVAGAYIYARMRKHRAESQARGGMRR